MLVTASASIYRVADATWAHARLGIIWWLGCLPVLTAPAATIWLVHAVRRHAAGDVVRGGQDASRYMWSRTMPALRLALVHLGIGLYYLASLNSLMPDGLLGQVVRAVVIATLVTWSLVAPWSFLLLERRARGAWDAIRSSYQCVLRRPDAAALSLASLLVGTVLLWLAPAPISVMTALVAPPVMVYVPLRCLAAVQKKHLDE